MVGKKKIRPGSADDLEGLARLPEESTSPVIRLDPEGNTLYANKFSRTLHQLVSPKTGKVDPDLVKTAIECYKKDKDKRIDYPVDDAVFELAVVPVHEFEYTNIYGRDVTETRAAVKQAADVAKFPNENPNPVMRAKAGGNVLFCNHASENIPGVIEMGPPVRLNTLLVNTVSEAMRTQENTAVHFESGEETFLFTVNPVAGEDYANIYGREITAEIEAQRALENANAQLERRVAERTASVRLLQNIVLAANSAESLEAALQTALHEICIYTNWPVGHAYVVQSQNGHDELIPTGIWHIETSSELSNLRQATERLRFGDASGLPGKVLEEGREVWIENLSQHSNLRRGDFMEKAGLKAGMAFPVTINTQVIGVLEFFSQEVSPTNIEIIKTLEHVGAQLGSVAERKAAEAAVKRSQEDAELAHSRLSDALEVIGQGFVLFDKDDNIALFNTKYAERVRKILGRDPVIGDNFEALIRASAEVNYIPDSMENKEEWIQRILAERRETKTRDSISKQNDGTWFRAEGYETSDGGTVSIFTDVTELKEHEQELDGLVKELGVARDAAVDANSAKSQFLANMSHELRTPLNAIIGYSELLIDDAEDDENEEYIPDLQKIQNAGKHLLGLINDILDLSKIEVGKIELFIEEFSVADMLEDVSNTIKPLVEKNQNSLEISISKSVGMIRSDLTKLRQNLFNLLSNAAKFTENGVLKVQVDIKPSKTGDLIVFDVIDQGIGMTPEQLEKIFEPFTQADSSTSKKFGGTGLGLTITREFSRMLGGDISAESEIDVGTTFTMTVAVDGNGLQGESQKAEEPATQGEVSADAPLVLIIDDDKNVRELLHRNLSTAGYRTELAANGKEGLEKAKSLKPDAITLDVIMPHTDGWSVLSQLKAAKDTADIPVVMVTIAEDRSLGFSLGAAEFLSKPVDRKKLVGVLNRFLQKREGSTVLLVEDDKSTRAVMRKYLEKEGAKVVEAENGRQGIDTMLETPPSLVLLDLMMPEMDGFGFVEEYRKHKEWHDIPIIVVTAKELSSEETRKLEGWVDALYSKLESSVDDVLKDIVELLPR